MASTKHERGAASPRTARMRSMRALLAGALAFGVGALAASADKGFGVLETKVREACECAAAHATGVDAAIQCSQKIREYARQTVEYRERWEDADRAVERRLRKLLEHCLVEAKGYVQSLDELDLIGSGVVPGIPPPRPPSVWYRVGIEELDDYLGSLSDVRTHDGASVKGMLMSVSAQVVTLRLAESDGGGERRIGVEQVQRIQVLHFPEW